VGLSSRLALALALGSALPLAACGAPAERPAARATPAAARLRTGPSQGTADIAAARELDGQGARAFAEGRFKEAARYFEDAHRRGAPAHMLWNIARCQQKLDDLEAAARVLERYLELPGLTAGDRDEARRELAEIQRKPSRLTVLTTPQGAVVYLGERRIPMGRTPITFEVTPGEHVVTMELAGHGAETEKLTARYGRAVVVETTLSR